jgi:hypothetical protein
MTLQVEYATDYALAQSSAHLRGWSMRRGTWTKSGSRASFLVASDARLLGFVTVAKLLGADVAHANLVRLLRRWIGR